jgi:hypothetical protein
VRLSRRELLAAALLPALPPDPFALPLERRRGGGWEPATVAPDSRWLALYHGAGWCGPCRAFMPRLVAAWLRLRAADVELVYVGDDASAAAQREYMARARMPWPAVRWDAPARRRLRAEAGAALPGMLVLDRTGEVVLTSWRAGRSFPADALARLLRSAEADRD